MTAPEVLGIAGFALSLVLATLRLIEFLDSRVRLKANVTQSFNYYGDSEQRDDSYEILLTNMGSRPTTLTCLAVHPYKRRKTWFKHVGSPEHFISDGMGLAHVTLAPGETRKFDFPFHQLNWSVGNAAFDEPTDGKTKRVKADGQLCRIYHTAARHPATVVLS